MDIELKETFGMILVKLDSLDEKVTKNSLEIESIKSDIQIIAEVQKIHMDQNEREHQKIITLIDKEIGLHSIILKNVTSDVRALEEDQKTLEREISGVIRKIR
ncbi:MAG: hypothetical protein P4L49_18460 [Desulfosporosinus sp.]|nr:hypothetical protein [Desulfosporosinus sp.]